MFFPSLRISNWTFSKVFDPFRRQSFRLQIRGVLRHLMQMHDNIINRIPNYGRWLDFCHTIWFPQQKWHLNFIQTISFHFRRLNLIFGLVCECSLFGPLINNSMTKRKLHSVFIGLFCHIADLGWGRLLNRY